MPSTNGHGSKPERVALYLRVSSEEQRDAGTIETQREFLLRHAERSGFEVAETYADDGISGTIPLHKRPEHGFLTMPLRARFKPCSSTSSTAWAGHS